MSAAQQLIQKGMQEGIQEGLIKGIREGVQQEKIELAKRILQKGSEINFIQEITGLSKEVIEKLKQE